MLSTVLIIDKRKELSIKYKKSIESLEVTTLIANTLKDAFVKVQSLEPDVILVSDSIEEELVSFCQKIRALTYNTRPVIIALSKSAEADDKIRVLETGADDFLSEPVNIEEFKSRIKAHIRRDIETNLDSKTLLPNKKIIEKILKRLIATDNGSALYIELDRLNDYKIFNTELASDKLKQTFIAIAKSAMNESDFIGQLNDNGFIIVTNKYSAEKLAEFLTFAFDTVVPKFYSEADAKRGYAVLKSDRYADMRINFVSLSIGGIITELNRFQNVEHLLSKLQEVKKLAKLPSCSNYLIERAQLTGSDSVIQEVVNKNIYIREEDESLRLLIQTSLELQGYDVLQVLDENESIQPKLVIMDGGDNLKDLELLERLKKISKFSNTKFIVTTSIHDKTSVLNAGADLYLPKPYEISDLLRWVEYFLKDSIY